MNSQKDRIESPGRDKGNRIARVAMLIDTTIAIVFCGIGSYHFTQPNQAWRSGTIEVVCAALLIIAAYLVDRTKAMVINLVVAMPICGIAIRHLIHGGGWRSGITELFLAIVLVVVAGIIHKPGKS